MKAIKLTEEEFKELSAIMSTGNTLLKEFATMLGLQHREFRGKLFSGKLDISSLSPHQLDKFNAARTAIYAVREQCEEKVRAGFKRMARKIAYTAARNRSDRYNTEQDFIQEADIAILDAVYGYTDQNIKLSTFVWRCIRNRITLCSNQLNPFCPLTNEAMVIIRRVEDARSANPTLKDDEIFNLLGFSETERDVFVSSVTKVVNEAPRVSEEDETVHDDYTGNRRGADKDFKEIFCIRDEARQALKDANLDNFELECILAEMYPYTGWKEDIAKRYVNKNTGKRYTRQNIEHVIERVKKKVKKVYLHPPVVRMENAKVDKFFEEWSGKYES